MRLESRDEKTVLLINDNTQEVLEWDVSKFKRTKLSTVDNVFKEINEYWEYIGGARQARIWDIYKEIHGIWLNTGDLTSLTRNLMKHVERLYHEMPHDEIAHWVKFHAKVRYQENLQHLHSPDDQNKGRTYLYSDYQGLIILTVAVRPMVPVWGEYISRIEKEIGGRYKEYNAYQLLALTWIHSSPYVERLREYIECSNLHTASNITAVLEGLGSDELPEYLLAFAVVRRVAVGDINASEERGSIISNIFGSVSTMLKDFDRRFGGGYTDKFKEDSYGDDESSVMEAYKVKQSVTIGDVETFLAYASDYRKLAHRIDPTVSDEMIDVCVANADKLITLPIAQIHLTLCQWLMAETLPARSIPLFNKPSLLRLIGVCQAIYWHWGFSDLAALLTAFKVNQDDAMYMSYDVKTRISNETLTILNQMYPHLDQSEKQGSARRSNVAYSSALAVTELIAANPWQIVAPEALAKSTNSINSRHVLNCPANITEILVMFIIHLNKHKNVKKEAMNVIANNEVSHG